MAQNNIVEWLGVILLFFFGITMIIQGHFIIHGKFGYRHSEREKQKMNNTRRQVEELFKEK
jgi:putative Mn2+ efflux pump MntP